MGFGLNGAHHGKRSYVNGCKWMQMLDCPLLRVPGWFLKWWIPSRHHGFQYVSILSHGHIVSNWMMQGVPP
jgi:hypothetical protein